MGVTYSVSWNSLLCLIHIYSRK